MRNRYSGYFKNGNRGGLGKFYYADGSTYEGQWKNGKKHGYGVFIDDNGKANYGFYFKDRTIRSILIRNTLLETLIKVDNKRKDTYLEYSRDSNMVNSPLRTGKKKQRETRIRSTHPRIMNNQTIATENHVEPAHNNRNRSEIVHQNSDNIEGEATGDANNSEADPSIDNENSHIHHNYNQATHETQQDEIMEIFSVAENSDPILKMTKEELDIFRKENLYFDLIKVNDFITDEGRSRIQIKLCETLLRHHSNIKLWYNKYVEKNEREYEEGFFLCFKSLTKLLKDCRLLNGRLNIANLGRLLTGYGERDFELYFNEKDVKDKIELMMKYDYEKPKQDSQATFSVDPYDSGEESHDKHNKTIANDNRSGVLSYDKEPSVVFKKGEEKEVSFEQKIEHILIDQFNTKKDRISKAVEDDKVLLIRGFVNAIIRAIYLKTGSINTLPQKVHKIFTERINPIIQEKIKPKPIIGEGGSILKRSKKLLDHFNQELKEIYENAKGLRARHNKNEFLDLKSFLDIIIVRKINYFF